MARDDGRGLELLDQVERRCDLSECGIAFEFGKHDAETVLPQGVGGYQRACPGFEKDDRVGIVSWCGMNLPRGRTKLDFGSWLQQRFEPKPGASLSRRCIGERNFVPAGDGCSLARRYPCANSGKPGLQHRISTAVVAVQMRVQEQIERPRAQNLAHQSSRLLRMRAVTGVDERGGTVIRRKKNPVRRQPAPFEDGHAFRQARQWHAFAFPADYLPDLNSRRRIFPTFVLGKSSRNSMYFGTL